MEGQLRATARLAPTPAFDVARLDQNGNRQDQGWRQAQQPQGFGGQQFDYAGERPQAPRTPSPARVAAINPFARRQNGAARNNNRAQRDPVAQRGMQAQ